MNKRQALSIVILLLVGAALAALILRARPGGSAVHDDHAHADAREHAVQGRSAARPKAEAGESAHAGTGVRNPSEPTPVPSGRKEPQALMLSEEQQQAAGITVEAAAPAQLATTVSLPGEIRLNEDRTAHVVPRVAGVVESVGALLGQPVKRGQVLAVIASTAVSDLRSDLAAAQRRLELARTTREREKRLWEERISAEQDYLQAKAALAEAEIAAGNARAKLAAIGVSPTANAGNRFELRAPFDGIVLEKHVALGEAVKEDTSIYTISDLSTVWANFNAAARDLNAVRVGAQAVVRAQAMGAEARGTVSYVGSLIGESTRTATARVTVPNPEGAWRPGLFVNVTLLASQRAAAVTVPNGAIQTVDGKPSVFVRIDKGFSAREVMLGLSDGRRTEVTSGLKAGEPVAAAGSFVLKSELEKGAAGHEH